MSNLKGSMVGHVFDPDKPETYPNNIGRLTQEARIKWCEEQTERYKIVKLCEDCGRKLIEGEQIPHGLKHASNGNVRKAAGTVLLQKPEDAQEALELIKKLIVEVK